MQEITRMKKLYKKDLIDLGFKEDNGYLTLLMPQTGVFVTLAPKEYQDGISASDLINTIDNSFEEYINERVFEEKVSKDW